MKKVVFCLTVFLPFTSLHAQEKPAPADLTTLSGKTYKQARVFRVEPDGINYIFAGGVAKIPFTDLPEAVRKQYGYNAAQAEAFRIQDERMQARLQSEAGALEEAQRQREAAASARAQADERSKNLAQKIKSQGFNIHTTLIKSRGKARPFAMATAAGWVPTRTTRFTWLASRRTPWTSSRLKAGFILAARSVTPRRWARARR